MKYVLKDNMWRSFSICLLLGKVSAYTTPILSMFIIFFYFEADASDF